MERLLCSSLLALITLGCGSGGSAIYIGLAGPFSDPVGVPMRLAAQLAVEELNASGGVNGRPLAIIERDDLADPDSAVGVAVALYHSDAVAVIGHLYSGTTLASAPVYNGGRNPVVQLSPSSSSPEVTYAGDFTFRVCPSDLAHGAALARWAYSGLKLTRAAVLYLNNEYGRGIRQTFVQEFGRLRGEVVETDPYLGDRPAVAPYLERLAREKRASFLLVAGNRSEAEEILRLSRQVGLDIPLLGGDALEGIENAGALAEGVYQSAAYLPDFKSPTNQRFVAAYRRKFPSARLPNNAGAATYDAVYLLRDVLARAGTDRRAVRDALAAVGTTAPAFEGVIGTIAFDRHGDVPNQTVVIGVVRDGQVQAVEAQ